MVFIYFSKYDSVRFVLFRSAGLDRAGPDRAGLFFGENLRAGPAREHH
jgi:hypothetical protein